MKNLQNKHLWTSLLVGAVIAGGAVAGNVTLPHVFQPNTPARASEVNANFNAVKSAVDDNQAQIQALATGLSALDGGLATLDSRLSTVQTSLGTAQSDISALQAAVASLSSRVATLESNQNQYVAPLVALQTSDILNSVAGTWQDVPGASVSITTTKTSTELRLAASGAIARYGGTAPWVRCALRFTLNGNPLFGADPNLGNLAVSPSAPGSAAEYIPFYMLERTSVPAGTHVIRVQLARAGVTGMTETGECAIFRWTFSRTRLEVQPL